MRQVILFLLLLAGSSSAAMAQVSTAARTPEEFGYRRLVVMFGRDSMQVLVKSPKGEEQLRKPLLLWAQGSLPRPLIVYDEWGLFGVLPFLSDSTRLNCHIVLISKPGIPLVVDEMV